MPEKEPRDKRIEGKSSGLKEDKEAKPDRKDDWWGPKGRPDKPKKDE